MATYCVRADGTATSKASATSFDSVASCMNIAVFQAETFSPGDTVLFSSKGGTFNATAGVAMPSDGSEEAHLVYGAEPGFLPVFDGGSTKAYPVNSNGKTHIEINDWEVQNAHPTLGDSFFLAGSGKFVWLNRIKGVVGQGNMVVGLFSGVTAYVSDSILGPVPVTHGIGVHNGSKIVSTRNTFINPYVNGIHAIDTCSVVSTDDVYYMGNRAAALGAIQPDCSGENIITRPKIFISKGSLSGIRVGASATVDVFNPQIIFLTGCDANNAGFSAAHYQARINIKRGLVYNATRNNTLVMGIQCVGTGGAQVTVSNTIFDKLKWISSTQNNTDLVALSGCCYYSSGSGLFGWNQGGVTSSSSITTQPTYKDAANYDFNPAPNSPCIGAGVDDSLIAGALGYDIGPYSYMPVWTPFDGSMPALTLSSTAPGSLLEVQEWSKPVNKKQIDKVSR